MKIKEIDLTPMCPTGGTTESNNSIEINLLNETNNEKN